MQGRVFMNVLFFGKALCERCVIGSTRARHTVNALYVQQCSVSAVADSRGVYAPSPSRPGLYMLCYFCVQYVDMALHSLTLLTLFAMH